MKARERLNRLYTVLSRFGMEHEGRDLLLRIGNGTMDDTRLDAFLDYMEAWLDKEE